MIAIHVTINTSAKDMFYLVFDCLFVCLFAIAIHVTINTSAMDMFNSVFDCLFVCEQLYVKTTERIFINILSEVYVWTRNTPLNFGRHPNLEEDLGHLKEYLPLCGREKSVC